MKKLKEHPILSTLMMAYLVGIGILMLYKRSLLIIPSSIQDVGSIILIVGILGTLIGYPLILTVVNSIFMLTKVSDEKWNRKGKVFEYITLFLGCLYTCIFIPYTDIMFRQDWPETLINAQRHTPIFTKSYPTIIVIACVGIVGYLFLSLIPLEKMPPLVIVGSISGMYLGIILCLVWIIQLWPSDLSSIEFLLEEHYLLLTLLPLNCVLIAIKTIRLKVEEWHKMQHKESRTYKYALLAKLNQKLMNSRSWPVIAFIFMWPLLGILIGILVIFGQEPDAIIKAWTETSDWNLSQHIAPQNIQHDQHYLCTVAAGGHQKVVKPLRLGKRHGHQVIVNRQLCIANAFEQILEERMPKIHRPIRNFYDKYGFPIAKYIYSPYVADLIYMLMKPLEWFFLIVIYTCDTKPENRIAVQYTDVTKGEVR